jgi:hypothetical protein
MAMKTILVGLTAAATFIGAFALVPPAPASADTIVVKDNDRDRHKHKHHHRDRDRDRDGSVTLNLGGGGYDCRTFWRNGVRYRECAPGGPSIKFRF